MVQQENDKVRSTPEAEEPRRATEGARRDIALPVRLDRSQQKKIATGTLQTLDNQIDTTTGTVKLKALFPNEDDSLFPNQFVNARLLVDTHHDVTLVPNTALQRNAQGAFVYFVKPDQTVAVHPVNVGVTDGNLSEVEGLDEGSVVATKKDPSMAGRKLLLLRPQRLNDRIESVRERGRTGLQDQRRLDFDDPAILHCRDLVPTRPRADFL